MHTRADSSFLWLSFIFLFCTITACSPDTEPPVIRLQGPDSMTVAVRTVFDDPGVVAFDKHDLDLADQVVFSGDYDPNALGDFVRIYTVTDAAGNSAQVSRVLHVERTFESMLGSYRSIAYTTGCVAAEGSTTVSKWTGSSFGINIGPLLGDFPYNNCHFSARYQIGQPYDFSVEGGNLSSCNYTIVSGFGYASSDADSLKFTMRLYSNIVGYFYKDFYFVRD